MVWSHFKGSCLGSYFLCLVLSVLPVHPISCTFHHGYDAHCSYWFKLSQVCAVRYMFGQQFFPCRARVYVDGWNFYVIMSACLLLPFLAHPIMAFKAFVFDWFNLFIGLHVWIGVFLLLSRSSLHLGVYA